MGFRHIRYLINFSMPTEFWEFSVGQIKIQGCSRERAGSKYIRTNRYNYSESNSEYITVAETKVEVFYEEVIEGEVTKIRETEKLQNRGLISGNSVGTFWHVYERPEYKQCTMDISSLAITPPSGAEATAEVGDNFRNDVATPQLVYQSNVTAVYRLQDKGIKVLVSPNVTEEQILRLVHEQDISKFLPSSCRKRHVIDVKGFKGDPAIHFKWANGITLKEWLRKAQLRPDVDLSVRLRAAIAIVETLIDFHNGGVVYNNLTPENIILDAFEGAYAATLIDLSRASLYHSKGDEFALEVKATDLKDLGIILNELFCGQNDVADEERKDCEEMNFDQSARKRGKRQYQGDGLPMCLGSLISTLLLSGDRMTTITVVYESAKDVLFDLRAIAKKPQIFLKPFILGDDVTVKSKLRLPVDAFYGRQTEMTMLMHALNSVIKLGGQPMMVVVSGYPGTG